MHATLFYTGKSISVNNSNFLFWLDMSVCNVLDCSEDIFKININEYSPLLHIILNSTLGVASVITSGYL